MGLSRRPGLLITCTPLLSPGARLRLVQRDQATAQKKEPCQNGTGHGDLPMKYGDNDRVHLLSRHGVWLDFSWPAKPRIFCHQTRAMGIETSSQSPGQILSVAT